MSGPSKFYKKITPEYSNPSKEEIDVIPFKEICALDSHQMSIQERIRSHQMRIISIRF
jgi:hypothetical protein